MAFKYKKGTKYGFAWENRYNQKGYKTKKDGTYIKPLDDALVINASYINPDGHKISVSAFQKSYNTILDKYGAAVSLKFKIKNERTMATSYEWGIYNYDKGTCYLKKHNIFVSTKKKHNGWCGTLDKDAKKQFYSRSKQSKKRN